MGHTIWRSSTPRARNLAQRPNWLTDANDLAAGSLEPACPTRDAKSMPEQANRCRMNARQEIRSLEHRRRIAHAPRCRPCRWRGGGGLPCRRRAPGVARRWRKRRSDRSTLVAGRTGSSERGEAEPHGNGRNRFGLSSAHQSGPLLKPAGLHWGTPLDGSVACRWTLGKVETRTSI
jgi:hypothetical protein